ncbi:hypothetical protein [Eudoraea sp.]|uniref:hypothetical protein n=1 Tax=Eudoraea sp. TaxID=1979955 RepID=UPI003C76111D
MKKIIIFISLALITFNCSNDDDGNTNINIRIYNVSEFQFENIIVNTGTGNVNFENIDPGELTDYKSFEIAYHYAFVELEIDGGTYTLQPIDYVGETPLKSGNYTYIINANDSREQFQKLTLTLIEE